MMKKLFALLCVPTFLFATSPVVSRYLPSHTASELVLPSVSGANVTVGLTAAHANQTFSQSESSDFRYSFGGLLELDGKYSLQRLITAGSETLTGYQKPFSRESGGDAWVNNDMFFSARSTLFLMGAHLGIQLPYKQWVFGAHIPFWHIEARQQYKYPIAKDTQYVPLPSINQVMRFHQYTHEDFGLKPDDFVAESVGDISLFAEWRKRWNYLWLFRSASIGGRLAVSAPTAAYANTAYPASIPLGGDGHWGIAASILPMAELQEGIRFRMPMTLAWQPKATQRRRVATYAEPSIFSPLVAPVTVTPGATFRIAPQIAIEHLADNLHLAIGYVRTKHWADDWEDARASKPTPAFPSRTTVPSDVITASVPSSLANMRDIHRTATSWFSGYVTFDAQYEMADIFASRKHAPVLRVTYDYCLSGERVARTHQLTVQLGWRF